MSKKSVIRRIETQIGIGLGVASLAVMGVFLGIKMGKKHEEPVSLTRVEEDTSDILDLSAVEEAPTAASLATPAPTPGTPAAPEVKPAVPTKEELMATAGLVDEEKPLAEVPETLEAAAPEKVEEAATPSTIQTRPITTHTVVANDTLISLARQYYGDGSRWRLIYEANNLTHQDRLVVGQKLVIPQVSKVVEKEKVAKVASPKKLSTPGRAHRVRVGDTLDKLALEYYNDASQWEKIFKANKISLANRKSLQPGEVLIIP